MVRTPEANALTAHLPFGDLILTKTHLLCMYTCLHPYSKGMSRVWSSCVNLDLDNTGTLRFRFIICEVFSHFHFSHYISPASCFQNYLRVSPTILLADHGV